jgi:hypothetical protein
MEEYKYDVYICYSLNDCFDERKYFIADNEITKIIKALRKAGISFWYAQKEIYRRQDFAEIIVPKIKASKIFLFLSTFNSNDHSEWIHRQISIASELNKCIIPVHIDPLRYSDSILFCIFYIKDLDHIDYYANPEKGLDDIINAINRRLLILGIKEEDKKLDEAHKKLEEEYKKLEEEYKQLEELISEEQKRRILNKLELVKKEIECLDSEKALLEYRQRHLERDNRQKQQSMIVLPKASCPPPNSKHRSLFSEIVSSIASLASGVASSASSMGKKIKSITDKTNVSYSALTHDFSKTGNVFSSVFAPAEVKRATHMLVQVYLHLPEETNNVQTLAQEADKNAKRRDYIPLSIQLKKGDMVDVLFGIYGETLLMSEKKSAIWMGSFTKCTFVFYVSNDLDIEELSCMAMLTVNGVPAGEMRFITKVVENPRQLNPEVFSKQYQKIFISYAHQDEPKVEQMARAYKAQGVDYFFDRHYLQPGDVFPLKIQEFIDSADLFILCWSVNAANSDYVNLERKRALERAYPKIKPIEKAPLRIYPMSIEPRAELPEDMRDTYNFEII